MIPPPMRTAKSEPEKHVVESIASAVDGTENFSPGEQMSAELIVEIKDASQPPPASAEPAIAPPPPRAVAQMPVQAPPPMQPAKAEYVSPATQAAQSKAAREAAMPYSRMREDAEAMAKKHIEGGNEHEAAWYQKMADTHRKAEEAAFQKVMELPVAKEAPAIRQQKQEDENHTVEQRLPRPPMGSDGPARAMEGPWSLEATQLQVLEAMRQPRVAENPFSRAGEPHGENPASTSAQPAQRRHYQPASGDVQEEAVRRLERADREQAIDREMRTRDPVYRAQQERVDAYRENAVAVRELTEETRKEKIAVQKMAADERVEYLAKKEAEKQQEAQAISKRSDMLRRNMDPQYAKEAALRDKREAKRLQAIDDAEGNERAQTMAMGGAAIGGKTGRMMGIAAQFMRPATMRAMGFGEKDEDKAVQPQVAQPAAEEKAEKKQAMPPGKAVEAMQKVAKPPAVKPAEAPATATKAAPAEGAGAGAADGAATVAAEAIPIVGAVIAVKKMIEEEIAEIGEKGRQGVRGGIDTAKAAIAMDPDEGWKAVTKGFDSVADSAAEAYPALKLVTPAAKEFVHGVEEMRGAVEQAAKKLSNYNAGLATQTAEQEVAATMRDISRASRFGAVTQSANEARFNMDQKLQDITDRFVPFVMKLGEKTFKLLEWFFGIVDQWMKWGLEFSEGVVLVLDQINQKSGNARMTAVLQELHNLIQTAIRDNDESGVTEQALFNEFLSGAINIGPGAVNPQAINPGPAIQLP
jgi:hypothetical protein